MAHEKKVGKGKGSSLKEALEAARADAGASGWFKVTEILAKIDNPLREYHVSIEETSDPS